MMGFSFEKASMTIFGFWPGIALVAFDLGAKTTPFCMGMEKALMKDLFPYFCI